MHSNEQIDLSKPFYIGDWLIEPKLNKISRHGEIHKVEPKLIEVLVYLAFHEGEVKTKDEIIQIVWKGTFITENVLSRAISKLRKILSDDAEKPHIIETIRKQGYRLIAPVKSFSSENATGVELNGTIVLRNQVKQFISNNLAISFLVTGIFIGGMSWFAVGSILKPKPIPVIKPLTSYSGLERDPKISPDGTRIAFSWTGANSGSNEENWDIYVKLINEENALRITTDAAGERNPVWSPDGSRIAFIKYIEGECNIFTVSALGGPSQKLAPCTLNTLSDLSWSPDGEWLAFSDREKPEDPHSIFLLSPETLEKRKITSPPLDFWGDLDPEFSPDSKKIALTRYAGEGLQDLYVINIDGTNEERLTFDNMNMSSYVWSKNAKLIYFSSNAGGGNKLWQITASGGKPELLVLGDNDINNPSVSRDGERLAYVRDNFDVNIWKFSIQEDKSGFKTSEKYIASTKWDMHPSQSPDGTKVAFTSNRSGTYEIWVGDGDGSNLLKLSSFEGSLTGTPRWSKDSKSIVFDARTKGQADLYTITVDGGSAKQLTNTSDNEIGGSWSSDGKWIYYSSNKTGIWEIWKMESNGDNPVQITFDGGMGAYESNDGTLLYHSKKETPGLWRLNLRTLEEEKIIDNLMPNDWASWALTDEGIFYVSRDPNAISYYDLATNEMTRVFQPENWIPPMDAALSVTSDGLELLLGQVDDSARDIMMLENFGAIQR